MSLASYARICALSLGVFTAALAAVLSLPWYVPTALLPVSAAAAVFSGLRFFAGWEFDWEQLRASGALQALVPLLLSAFIAWRFPSSMSWVAGVILGAYACSQAARALGRLDSPRY